MVLIAEAMQIRLYQFRRQFSVGSGNRPNLATCHLDGRAALIDINVGGFRTKDGMVRTGHQLQSHRIAARTVEYEQRQAVRRKGFPDFRYGFFRPFIIAISQCMVYVCPVQRFHNQRMHTGIIV